MIFLDNKIVDSVHGEKIMTIDIGLLLSNKKLTKKEIKSSYNIGDKMQLYFKLNDKKFIDSIPKDKKFVLYTNSFGMDSGFPYAVYKECKFISFNNNTLVLEVGKSRNVSESSFRKSKINSIKKSLC